MSFETPDLPYPKDALAPVIGAETVSIHHDKHQRGYVDKLNELLVGDERADLSLEDVISGSTGDVFNCAAQAWNHDFYWRSLTPDGSRSAAELGPVIESSFGSSKELGERLVAAGAGEFGSGWVWLLRTSTGGLAVASTSDAGTFAGREDLRPLAVIDVWEHAYYLDYQNERKRYLNTVVNDLLNWDFILANFHAR